VTNLSIILLQLFQITQIFISIDMPPIRLPIVLHLSSEGIRVDPLLLLKSMTHIDHICSASVNPIENSEEEMYTNGS